ncbi:MAG: exosortase-dependent surface protein XDP1 [Rhodocyclaceae bacterium]|nr:exosortase-dependent surface protein XDP1 [Rhodocyclaceae bacterium]
MKSKLSYMVVVAGMALASMGAHAAWNWQLDGTPTGTDLPGTASVMGYSASSNTAVLVATNATGLPDLNWYSGGYGICSTGDTPCGDAPEHAMDNNGYKESIVLSFVGKMVTLSSLNIGWAGADSDMSVLAYTGTGTPVSGSSTYGNLLTNGWSLVGQYANVSTSTNLNLGTALSSSYWLIAAYNSTFGGTCTGGTCGDGNDYVKLFAVAGNTSPNGKVPEPAVLLLFGTALMGVVGLRRRRQTEN